LAKYINGISARPQSGGAVAELATNNGDSKLLGLLINLSLSGETVQYNHHAVDVGTMLSLWHLSPSGGVCNYPVFIEKNGEPCRIRTCDPLIKRYSKGGGKLFQIVPTVGI
jgi:hypothetical protein